MKRVLLVLIFAIPTPAFGWSAVGHEVVCNIAYAELNSRTKSLVNELIALEPRMRRGGRDVPIKSLGRACLYADFPKQRRPEHFINVPRTQITIDSSKCVGGSNCLFSGIKKDVGVLRSNTASKERKLDALMFLGHWFGDIHQPLHVSYRDDKGGNSIKARGKCSGNLHAVWDRCIVDKRLGKDPRTIANRLRREINRAQRREWRRFSLRKIASESYWITTNPSVRYCLMKGDTCWYTNRIKTYRRGAREKIVQIKDAYLDEHSITVNRQLKKAGVRYAAILNRNLRKGRNW